MRGEPPLNSAQFDRLLVRLAVDIVDAAVFRRLHRDLLGSEEEFSREFAQSQAFWSLSLRAYIEAALYRLIRVYVGHNAAHSLGRWLDAIKRNPQLFSTPPDPDQLTKDIEFVKTGAVVKKLTGLRGNFVAHINWSNIADDVRVGHRFDLSFQEIDQLVSRAMEILNRYGNLFKRTSWSPSIVGHDDYQTILKALRHDLERWDAERVAEREPAKKS